MRLVHHNELVSSQGDAQSAGASYTRQKILQHRCRIHWFAGKTTLSYVEHVQSSISSAIQESHFGNMARQWARFIAERRPGSLHTWIFGYLPSTLGTPPCPDSKGLCLITRSQTRLRNHSREGYRTKGIHDCTDFRMLLSNNSIVILFVSCYLWLLVCGLFLVFWCLFCVVCYFLHLLECIWCLSQRGGHVIVLSR